MTAQKISVHPNAKSKSEPMKCYAKMFARSGRGLQSIRMTPLSKDNCWWRNMRPTLEAVGLEWANSLVMRRTHSRLVPGHLGHTLDVNQNAYRHSPVESRLVIVNHLEKFAGTMTVFV